MDFLINKDNEIITKVLTHFNEDYLTHKYFNDGTQSRVILLNNKFLIKQNTEKAIRAEVEFLLLSKIDKFQKILYVDPTYQFAVYEFIEGDVMKSVDDIDDLISNIVFITTHYKFYNHDGFGYLGEEFNSWSEFLDSEVTYSSSNFSNYISDNRLVFNCIKDLEKYKFNKRLLHGDFGTHNFIKQNGKFIGAIDPMPVIGDYLYDLFSAVFSNTGIVSKLSLEEILNLVDEPRDKMIDMIVIVLYIRISRCLKYHPVDIGVYMRVWDELSLTFRA